MGYTPVFNLYPDGWKNRPSTTTPMINTAMNQFDSAFRNIESYLEENPLPGANLDSLTDVEITDPKEGDLLVFDGEMYRNGIVGSTIDIDGEYNTNLQFSSGFRLVGGGYFTVGSKLVITKMTIGYSTNFSGSDNVKIASGFPTPSFPDGISASYGQLMLCTENNLSMASCYIDTNGDLYYKKNSKNYTSFGSSGNIVVNVQYIKE